MSYEYTCKRCGKQAGTIHKSDADDGVCFMCREEDVHRASGRPDCINGDGRVVTASQKAYDAGERRCYSCWYGDYMDTMQDHYAELFAPFRAAGHLCEVMQTGGMVMLPIVWFSDDGKNYGLGLSAEVDHTWVAVLYQDYGEESEQWADVDLGEVVVDSPNSQAEMAYRAFDYLSSQRWKEDLPRLQAV